MGLMEDTVARIGGLDESATAGALERQDMLTKPQGSLGRLEELSVHLAGIQGKTQPSINNKAIVTMAGDHGVTAEGVSLYPSEVTPQMVYNFLRGGAAINVLARQASCRVLVVDMGVAAELDPHPDLVSMKVDFGTGNLAKGPAMSREQAREAVEAGIKIANQLQEEAVDIIGTGDMGIGNTTPSSCITAVYTGWSPGEVTGKGTGLDEGQRQAKAGVVARAIEVNQPDASDALDVLAKVGGYEIGGIAGLIIGAAALRIPVIIDGFISGAGALIAAGIAPRSKQFMIAAHRSQEPGHQAALNHLGLRPLLDLDMRLGEGTGAAIGMNIAEAACRILSEMATFAEAGVSEAEEAEVSA